MGWKNMAKLASEWADAKKTELLTTDHHRRDDAEHRMEETGKDAQAEAVTSFLERVLPPSLSQAVTDARPENVAKRREEAELAAEHERRERIAAATPHQVTLELGGGEHGSATLPMVVERDERPGDEHEPAWLVVRAEVADPAPVGSTTVCAVSVAVPAYAGPGRYDLADLMRRGEAGDLPWWEPFDLYVAPTAEVDDRTWYWDASAEGPAVVEVGDAGLTFDLAMASAVSAVRVRGTIGW